MAELLESSESGTKSRPKAGKRVETAALDQWRALRNAVMHGTPAAQGSSDQFILLLLRLIASDQSLARGVEKAVRGEAPQSQRSPIDDLAGSAHVARSFIERLAEESELVSKLTSDEALRLGRAAADRALAAMRWAQIVGDRIETSQVTKLLGVSRQALAKRLETGSALGVPGDGTTWYPTWQFDREAATIRPELREIIGIFRDQLGNVDPLVIAAWATTSQEEDLEGYSPSLWLVEGRGDDQLRKAAHRAAARLGR